MGKPQSKVEEKVVVQNTVNGNNEATVEEFKFHLTTTNALLSFIVLAIGIGMFYVMYKVYKKCHRDWITTEINRVTLRGSLFRRPPPPTSPRETNYPEVV